MTIDLFAKDEGNTPLTHEERLGLIPTWVTLRHELNEVEQANILEGERWAFTRSRDVLHEAFLRDLHRRMFGQVWKWAGEYSKENNRRIGSDSFMIVIHLHQLLDDVRCWIEHQTYTSDQIAIRFHNRLAFVHPFPNGNGRHGRLAADLLIMHLGGERFTWGRGNLIDQGAARRQYLDGQHAADRHDIEPLLAFARS